MPAIANHVDEHVGVELLPVFDRDLHALDHRFRVVAVHVHDRCLDHGSKGSAIVGTAGIIEICGEAYLVVYDEMDRASGGVSFKIAHLKYLIDDTLSRHRRIPVDENRKYPVELTIVQEVGLGTGKAQHHGIHRFKMGGIRHQFQAHLTA